MSKSKREVSTDIQKNDIPGPTTYELVDGHGYINLKLDFLARLEKGLRPIKEKPPKSTYRIKGISKQTTKREND